MTREDHWTGYLEMAQNIADLRGGGRPGVQDYNSLDLPALGFGLLSYLGAEPPAGLVAEVARKKARLPEDLTGFETPQSAERFLRTLDVVDGLLAQFRVHPSTNN